MLGGGASVRDAGAPLLIAVPIASRVDAWGPTLMKTEGDPQGLPCQGPCSPPESGVKDMAYTAYKFKSSFIEERLKSYKSNLMKFKGHDNLVANAVRVIRERLEADFLRSLLVGHQEGSGRQRRAARRMRRRGDQVRLFGRDRRGDHRDGRGVQPNPSGTLASNDMDHPPDA